MCIEPKAAAAALLGGARTSYVFFLQWGPLVQGQSLGGIRSMLSAGMEKGIPLFRLGSFFFFLLLLFLSVFFFSLFVSVV